MRGSLLRPPLCSLAPEPEIFVSEKRDWKSSVTLREGLCWNLKVKLSRTKSEVIITASSI